MPAVILTPNLKIPEPLKLAYEKAVSALETHHLSLGLHLEKIGAHNDALFSVRLSRKARLLLTQREAAGETCWQVIDIIPTHDYHKSSYLKLSTRSRIAQEPTSLPTSLEVTTREEIIDGRAITELNFYQDMIIKFSATQSEALAKALPLAISGGPGAGKTCIGISVLLQFAEQVKEGGKVLFLAPSLRLVEQVKATWEKLPFSPPWVEFKTYEELISSLAANALKFVGDDHLKKWLSDYIKHYGNVLKSKKQTSSFAREFFEGLDSMIQEFRTLSAYNENELSSYLNIGSRNTLYQNEDEKRWLFKAYFQYQAHLSKEGVIHPAFYVIEDTDLFDAVVVDETHNFSRRQILNPQRLAKNRHICYLTDSNQSVGAGSLSILPYVAHLVDDNVVSLSESYRCPPAVLELVNDLLDIKRLVLGGYIDKITARHLVGNRQDVDSVHWLKTGNEADAPHLLAEYDSTDFAIVTHPQFVQEARDKFNTPLVLTPLQVQGLEYKTIVAYRLFDSSITKGLNEAFHATRSNNAKGASESSIAARVSRNTLGNGNEQYAVLLNELLVAFTRTTNTLIIYQQINHQNAYITQYLEDKILTLKAHQAAALHVIEKSRPKSPEEKYFIWEIEAKRQRQGGNEDVAQEIERKLEREKNPSFSPKGENSESYPIKKERAVTTLTITPPEVRNQPDVKSPEKNRAPSLGFFGQEPSTLMISTPEGNSPSLDVESPDLVNTSCGFCSVQ